MSEFIALWHILILCKGKRKINRELDDKKLKQDFDIVIVDGLIDGKPINKAEFSREFIKFLLQCRYLFDKHIIKREYTDDDLGGSDDSRGHWSLGEPDPKNNKNSEKTILMLQACLRVSYTSPEAMHWITYLLEWLYNEDPNPGEKYKEYEDYIEDFFK